jgi:hypothetical protein
MDSKQYILKEILSEAELELFLRLRYNSFCSSASSLFVENNDKAIDVNYYDRNSLHYGVYKRQQKKSEPIGYFRIVLEEPTMADAWVKSISARTGLTGITEHKPRSILPCLGIYPNSSLETGFYTEKAPDEKAGEVSRFFIVKGERSIKLSLQIIRSAFAIGLLHLQHAFIGCFQDHSKVYTSFGFMQYPGSSIFSIDSRLRQKKGVILYCRVKHLATEVKGLYKMTQDEFLAGNCLAFKI